MTTETMREAVARAMVEPLGYPNTLDWERVYVGDVAEDGSLADLCRDLADAAIRTVLERLREPSDALLRLGVLEIDAVSDDPDGYPPTREQMRAGWQAMLDAAAREVG